MADNIKVLASTDPTAVPVATETCTVNAVAGVQVPLGKVGFGAANTFVEVTSAVGLPTDVLDRSGRLLGHVTVDTMPALAAGTAVVGKVGLQVGGSDVAGGNPVPVSGTVAISGTVPVSGTVGISGTVAVASVAGSVEISNDAGNPVPVSGSITSTPAGDVLTIGGTSYTILRGFANPSASGDNTILAGTATKKIRVLSFSIGPVAGAVNAKFKTSSGADISSLKNFPINGGMGRAFNPYGHFETVAGDGLVLNLSAAVASGVDFQYILV